MTTAIITLDDAWRAVRRNSTGSAPKLLQQARRCLEEFARQKDALDLELAELASIEHIDSDTCEIRLVVHRQRIIGRFVHALTEQGYLLGQFAFSLVQHDDKEQALWAFTFEQGGTTRGIAEERRDELGIGTVLVRDALAHLIARVQETLPRLA